MIFYKGNCLLFFLLVVTASGFSQDTINKDTITTTTYSPQVLIDSSSVIIPADSLAEKKQLKPHSPTKAAIFSAIIPGAGQVYNKKYWKLPIIYAGFGGLGYLFLQNNKQFTFYRDILEARSDSSALYVDPLPNVPNEQIFAFREDFRRYRDLCFVGMFAIYVLNIIDASVDAHLFTFDVSEDLSLNIQPYVVPAMNYSAYSPGMAGLGLKMKF